MADAGSSPKVVGGGKAITDGPQTITQCSKELPLPCITILIHGVNDVGEAYDAQERGVCRGLNERLNRSYSLNMNGKPDLIPTTYRLPPKTEAEIKAAKKEDLRNPDAVYFRRKTDLYSKSPVIPFYWGSREQEAFINKKNWSGQWTDRYGNRIDKNGAKNGGPFANATSELPSTWSEIGFDARIFNMEWLATMKSGPTHNLVKACPRAYMLLAAKRLAMLIKMIRTKHKEVAINILGHSQGTIITMLAHAMLADGSGDSADTVIFQHTPYGFQESNIEWVDKNVRDNQQTTQARVKTLKNIVTYVQSKKAATPPLSELKSNYALAEGVVGTNWKPGGGAQKFVHGQTDNPYSFTERDNRGKVYLYFCPNDHTVSYRTVQGIGWQGVPDTIKAPAFVPYVSPEMKRMQNQGMNEWQHTDPPSTETIPVLSTFGTGFMQRVFTSRKIDDKPAILVGEAPRNYEMRHWFEQSTWGKVKLLLAPVATLLSGEESTTGGIANKGISEGETRFINAEKLDPPIAAYLFANESRLGKLKVGVMDANIAAGSGGVETLDGSMPDFRDQSRWGSPLNAGEMGQLNQKIQPPTATADPSTQRGIIGTPYFSMGQAPLETETLPYIRYKYHETPDEAIQRWANKEDDNSYHSSIPANPDHAAWVTAYDLSIGAPLPIPDLDKETGQFTDWYMEYLRCFADWRTDWDTINKQTTYYRKKIIEQHSQSPDDAKQLITENQTYYTSGKFPTDIADKNGVATMAMPSLIVSQTLAQRKQGIPPATLPQKETNKTTT
jgi:hypothetical protein